MDSKPLKILCMAFEKEIKRLLDEGKTPREAVRLAYKKYPIMEELEKSLHAGIHTEMEKGYGAPLPKVATSKAAAKAWVPDGLTLSKRIHKNAKQIQPMIANTIMDAIKQGKSIKATSMAMYDGYGKGGIIERQKLPGFMAALLDANKKAQSEIAIEELKEDLKAVRKKLQQQTTEGMKAGYKILLDAIDSNNKKRINHAINVAVNERTRYVAERIARTELARAYMDGFIAKHDADDDIVAYQWKMNARHPVTDICDVYANADMYNLGKGIFPKGKVPNLPAHPHCMCRLKPLTYSQVNMAQMKEQIEEGKERYIASLPNYLQDKLLGVSGAQAFRRRLEFEHKKSLANVLGGINQVLKSRIQQGNIIELDRYTVNGVEYVVDGKHVFNGHTEYEKGIARALSQHLEADAYLVPQIVWPSGIRTPDFLINGESYELKTPSGRRKTVIYDMVKKGKGQASRFVVDLKALDVDDEFLNESINMIFNSDRTKFVEMLIFMKGIDIIRIEKR